MLLYRLSTWCVYKCDIIQTTCMYFLKAQLYVCMNFSDDFCSRTLLDEIIFILFYFFNFFFLRTVLPFSFGSWTLRSEWCIHDICCWSKHGQEVRQDSYVLFGGTEDRIKCLESFLWAIEGQSLRIPHSVGYLSNSSSFQKWKPANLLVHCFFPF